MIRIRPALPILVLLPSLAVIPVLFEIGSSLHNGGIKILIKFFSAAFQPSLDSVVIQSSLRGLQITIATALISWAISILLGVSLGIVSSRIVWETFKSPNWISTLIRRFLAIPRSIHELVWGLLLLQVFGLSPWIAIVAISIPHSAMLARVLSDQLDALDQRALIAFKHGGVNPFSALITALLPQIIPILASCCGYRLECALRSATLLGVFGMGGIGVELQLTLQSLEFNEMWTALWMLGIVMIAIERAISFWRIRLLSSIQAQKQILIFLGAMFFVVVIGLIWLQQLDLDLLAVIQFHSIKFPSFIAIKDSILMLPLIELISKTLLITLLASGIAIGLPPLGMLFWQTRNSIELQSYIWSILRLIPPPLTALLLLLCTNPSVSVAALALGIHNIGVMGRFLKEGISNQDNNLFDAMIASGSSQQLAWLYGNLSVQSKSYLAYAAYRTDVLLRETAVVGVVGGVGLGWQLQESLSSFDWGQVTTITIVYSTLTLIGESFSDKLSEYLQRSKPNRLLRVVA